MPFTQAILEMALNKAGGRKIRSLHLRVGWLSAIVPDSVEVFFDYLSKGTLAQGARLDFDIVPIQLTCQSCGRIVNLRPDPQLNPRQALADAFRSGCPCGRGNYKVTDGLGFDLEDITVED
ncbi:MAG: hydrogenase maturation nickel metallochaperone HypA [Desulfobacterales bacterium]